MVIDNVDREYQSNNKDPQAYDVLSFFPPADYGSLLITTRLPGWLGSPKRNLATNTYRISPIKLCFEKYTTQKKIHIFKTWKQKIMRN